MIEARVALIYIVISALSIGIALFSLVFSAYLVQKVLSKHKIGEKIILSVFGGDIDNRKIGTCPTLDAKYRFLQRSYSFLFSMIAIISILPVFAIIVFAKIAKKQNVFKIQQKIGYRGRRVNLIRFDSNYPDKFNLFIRRSSLDYLPRLFNVLIGDLNIVGINFYTVLEEMNDVNIYLIRYACRPGLINGFSLVLEIRRLVAGDDSITIDCAYLSNFKIKKDFLITISLIYFVLVDVWNSRATSKT